MSKNQKVTFQTKDNNSVVYMDNEEIGSGKTFTTKIEKTGDRQIVVRTPGYKDESIALVMTKLNPLVFPLGVFDIIPYIYSFGSYGTYVSFTPKCNLYNESNSFINKTPYTNRKETEKYINILAINLNIKDKENDIKTITVDYGADIQSQIRIAEEDDAAERAIILKAEAKKKSKKPTTGKLLVEDKKITNDDTKLSYEIFQSLKKTNYIDTINRVFQDDNNTLFIKGSITNVTDYKIVTRVGRYHKYKVTVNWRLFNIYDEILDSIILTSLSGDYIQVKDDYKIYADVIDQSFCELKESGVFKKLINADTDFSIKDAALKITAPKNAIKDLSDASLASVIVKRKDKGHGSGFAISNDGYILTNFHVIAGKKLDKQEELTVILSNGEELKATIVRYNRARDIALLKVDYTFEKAFLLKNAKEFKNLTEVYTIGAPKSIELGQTVTLGLISNERKANNHNLLQLSMSINSGNSGGPLFEKSGVLHGIIQAKLVGYATEGVGFAIPSYLIPDYLNISLQ